MIEISKILLEKNDQYFEKDGYLIEYFGPISKINILVGANNSGKSRFLRRLAGITNYKIMPVDVELFNLCKELESSLDEMINLWDGQGITSSNNYSIDKLKEFKDIPKYLSYGEDVFEKYRKLFSLWCNFPDGASYSGSTTPSFQPRIFIQHIRDISKRITSILSLIPSESDVSAPRKLYIPVLRGLRSFDENRDIYLEKTKKDYFLNNNDTSPEIFTGLSFYNHLIRYLLGNNAERKLISEFQTFLSNELFEKQPVTLIPKQSEHLVVVKIGHEEEKEIQNLGDGIQSLIILTFLPFLYKEPTIFFIEEPEMYLHPGLQRKLLKYLAVSQNHRYFLTTHSNHFLDLTIDYPCVSIFTFRKELDSDTVNDEQQPKFRIESVDTSERSSLELLGVRNSSVFLVNATIWVEGITDRWYLRKMLESYQEHLDGNGKLTRRIEEDVHYSFVEYGGSNITHWSFLDMETHPIQIDTLCAKAILVTDKDGKTKLERKSQLTKKLGNRFIILPCREIENALPLDVITKVVSIYEGKPIDIKDSMSYESYKDKYLGDFITEDLLNNKTKRKGGYKTPSGTIKTKVDFCEKSLPDIKYENLQPEIQKIIKRIYDFVIDQNK